MDRNAESQAPERKTLDYERLEIGERLPSYEYLLTREMLEQYRQGVQDPDARFPTIAVKADIGAYHRKYEDVGSVNARCAYYCYNPPVAGKKIRVTAWIADKYVRREKPYIVTEAVSVDEDGRLIDRVITHELKRPREVGKKWER